MIPETVPPIIDLFNDIKDPRIDRKKCYPLIEVITITLLAAMTFAKGWEDIELYRKTKKGLVKTIFPLS
ncbi:MAG: transposase family protein [Treponema sp.]|jgi:hypothetical protein|nr:transposase family protein [Treponema sp.]